MPRHSMIRAVLLPMLVLVFGAGSALALPTAELSISAPRDEMPRETQTVYRWETNTAFHTEQVQVDAEPAVRAAETPPETDGLWVVFPGPTSGADRLTHAVSYDPVNNKVYTTGGTPNGNSGSNVTTHQRWDPVTNTWTTMASMPVAKGWIHGCYVNGTIRIFGGYTNSSSASADHYVYTIATNTWSTSTALPRSTVAMAVVTYQDRYVYVMGGTNSGLSGSVNTINVWDNQTSTWSTATNLPAALDMYSAVIVDNKIVITNGYTRGVSPYWCVDSVYVGTIQSSPTTIVWTKGAAVPTPWTSTPKGLFLAGTGHPGDGIVYTVGGSGIWTTQQTTWAWSYDPDLDTVIDIPDHGYVLGRCAYAVGASGTAEVIVCAGDSAMNWAPPNSRYLRNQFKLPHDVGVDAIMEPTGGKIDSGTVYTPWVQVKNYGLNSETDIPVTFRVDSMGTTVYTNATLIITSVPPDSVVDVVFTSNWIPMGSMWTGYNCFSWTTLSGDGNGSNDTASVNCLITSDTIYSIYRSGAAPNIDGYMAPGEWAEAYFVNASNVVGWSSSGGFPADAAYAYFLHDGSYLYSAYVMPYGTTRDIGDQVGFYCDENNDGAWESTPMEGNYWFWVNATSVDEVLFRYWTDPWTPGQPQVAPGATAASGVLNGYYVIESRVPFGTLPYQLTMNPNGDTAGVFFYEQDNGAFYGWWRANQDDTSYRYPSEFGTMILLPVPQSADIAADAVLAPTYAQPGAVFTPRGRWRNYGPDPASFTGVFKILDPTSVEIYNEQVATTSPVPNGGSVELSFPDTSLSVEGEYTAICSTVVGGDPNPGNNVVHRTFRVSTAPPYPPGWVEVTPIPSTPSGRPVKRGGWATFHDGLGRIFQTKGNKSGDFHKFDPTPGADIWYDLEPMPLGAEGKPPDKGSKGCTDHETYIYATKGKNTPGFWRYTINESLGLWEQFPDVPLGPSGKKVKGGTDILYIPFDSASGGEALYLLKGYRTEFYRFNIASETWEQLPDAPAGTRAKWDKGSWLVWDGDQTLYAHKAKYHDFYTFDLLSQTWATTPLTGMPYVGRDGRRKKSKDGGSSAWFNGSIYALKGGNTGQWWKYTPPDSIGWEQLEDLPENGSTGRRRRVKYGADVVGNGAGAFWSAKGNKTFEFWRYALDMSTYGSQPARSGVQTERVAAGLGLTVAPNPLAGGFATLRYALPKAGPATLVVHDVVGRSVVRQNVMATRTGSVTLDLRNLSAGIYLVRLDAEGYTATEKLVVQH